MVAVHGKYSRTNTISDMAVAALNHACPVCGFIAVRRVDSAASSKFSFPVYNTPSVDTTISLAGARL